MADGSRKNQVKALLSLVCLVLWLNLRSHRVEVNGRVQALGFSYGWPCEAMTSLTTITGKQTETGRLWRPEGIVINVLVALAIIGAVWLFCEWWIRRRAARKDA
jgi:hypothetical protein